jgi:predicted metal-dependent phosphoesterase TrpH
LTLIDLHAHTNESDGTYTPAELVEAALAAGLGALAITDHDTFAGYEAALPVARERGLDLIRGVEISARRGPASLHLLAYFLDGDPGLEFHNWLRGLVESRRERNRKLVARLRELGVDIHLHEVERLGKTLTGRPHFARVLIAKGYAEDRRDAFRKYLGETAAAHVEREAPPVSEAILRVLEAGGVPSLAHPIRNAQPGSHEEMRLFAELKSAGLPAIEAYHSDHGPGDTRHYLAEANHYGFGVTGGSDFHGDAKPGVMLGRGLNGNLSVPISVLEDLRALSRSLHHS